MEQEAKLMLLNYASGDARRLINLIEMAINRSKVDGKKEISQDLVKKILTDKARRFDKGGDQFYDQISALHKSVRGSDPDASLYWFFRMLDGGADPLYLARRIVRIAGVC